MARRTPVKIKVLKIGSQEWTGHTVEEAEKRMNEDLDRIFKDEADHPIVIPYRDANGKEHVAIAYRDRMGVWHAAGAYQPKFEGRSDWPCYSTSGQDRKETEILMRRHIAGITYHHDHPHYGEQFLDPRDREGLADYRAMMTWQLKYRECANQGLPDHECRRQADLARYATLA